MGERTAIQWTDKTWNPWHGCAKVSPGCDNCYMFAGKKRYGQDPTKVVRAGAATFNAPLRWKAPARVFTCSWSDWFIRDADPWRDEAWGIVATTPHLTYQILTKRPVRIRMHTPRGWPNGLPNVWLGTSVETRQWLVRANVLRTIPAAVRFLSLEPLLEDLGVIDLAGIRWVIVGGESGPGARPCDLAWIRNVVRQCRDAGVPVFVKQLGSRPRRWLHAGPDQPFRLHDRKGGDMTEWPEDLRIREFPLGTPGGEDGAR